MDYKRLFIENTYVFITMVTHKRQKILISNINVLRDSFAECKNKHEFEIFAIVILPDHIHMLIKPANIDDYPKIIGHIKKHFTTNSNIEYQTNKNRESTIWQRRYWEHTIRDDDDLHRHLDYIHYNPIKHGYIDNLRNWEHSSFQKFVKLGYYTQDWCNISDRHNIGSMNLE